MSEHQHSSPFRSSGMPAIYAAAMDYAYKKGWRDGKRKAGPMRRGELLREVALWLGDEATLSVGLSQFPEGEDAGARIGLLVRLEEVAGTIDGLTEPLLVAPLRT